jgi:ectoine hydroxylase-related dioxygenase (phytanoyl-CoA dioxygenase family)
MSERERLLTTLQMAEFVARGFLRFDAVVPEALNARFMQEVETGPPQASPAGTPLADCYADSVVREIVALPVIAGAIESLVGPGCLFDHQGTHFNPPAGLFERTGTRVLSQHTHQDSTIDTRRRAFDVQMFYFPHEVTPEMGGTRFVPGTHLRRVSEMACARYQNVLGQKKVVCPAGSVMFCHHGLWHGGEINRSDRTRFMLKIRLNPVVRQTRLWNTDDLGPEMAKPQPIFVFSEVGQHDPGDVQRVLCRPERWFEMDTGRLEYVNRIRLWRHLIGDDDFDAHHWLTRLENEPE